MLPMFDRVATGGCGPCLLVAELLAAETQPDVLRVVDSPVRPLWLLGYVRDVDEFTSNVWLETELRATGVLIVGRTVAGRTFLRWSTKWFLSSDWELKLKQPNDKYVNNERHLKQVITFRCKLDIAKGYAVAVKQTLCSLSRLWWDQAFWYW